MSLYSRHSAYAFRQREVKGVWEGERASMRESISGDSDSSKEWQKIEYNTDIGLERAGRRERERARASESERGSGWKMYTEEVAELLRAVQTEL